MKYCRAEKFKNANFANIIKLTLVPYDPVLRTSSAMRSYTTQVRITVNYEISFNISNCMLFLVFTRDYSRDFYQQYSIKLSNVPLGTVPRYRAAMINNLRILEIQARMTQL